MKIEGRQLLRQRIDGLRIMSSFHARTVRERVLIVLTMLLLLTVVLFYGVIRPSYAAYQQSTLRLNDARALHQRLLMSVESLTQTPVELVKEDRDSNALRKVFTLTAQQVGFVADRIQVESEGRIQVWSARVSYLVVARWLEALAQQRVTLVNLHINKLEPGLVSLQATLD